MLGLALEGGGSRGAYHIGAYKACRQLGLEFDAICGSSIGAVNAALLCQGPVTITGCEAVDKSYPGFFEELRGLQR